MAEELPLVLITGAAGSVGAPPWRGVETVPSVQEEQAARRRFRAVGLVRCADASALVDLILEPLERLLAVAQVSQVP